MSSKYECGINKDTIYYHINSCGNINCIIDKTLNKYKKRYGLSRKVTISSLKNEFLIKTDNGSIASIYINEDIFESNIVGIRCYINNNHLSEYLSKFIGMNMYCVSRDYYNMDTEETVRLSGFIPDSLVNGEGSRNVVFFQGCSLNCPGCFNPCTHDFNGGEEYNIKEFVKNKLLNNPLIDGITFSGGNPFENPSKLAQMICYVKKYNPKLSIWVYSGFTIKKIINDAVTNKYYRYILGNIDVIVDGKFEEDLKGEFKYRGSSNQKFIDVKNTIISNKIITLEY